MASVKMSIAGLVVSLLLSVSTVWADVPYGATSLDQSAFALGSVTLNVILLDSDGTKDADLESWTLSEIDKIRSEIDQAVNFWESQTAGFHPNAQLNFNVEFINNGQPMATKYEPISRSSSSSATRLWINEVMGDLGYFGSSQFTTVRNFNEDQRVQAGTDWATTLFVVHSKEDVDGRFSDGGAAFAYVNGPYLVTTYDNGGWGINSYDKILSHELGHIFGALDEYFEANRDNEEVAGYLGGVNGNSQIDRHGNFVNVPEPNSLMLNASQRLSEYTRAQVGLVDTDGDGIPDILDTQPKISGKTSKSDSQQGLFIFEGFTEVNPLDNKNPQNIGFSNSTHAMTINRITSAWVNIDNTGWVELQPTDGEYGDHLEILDFSITQLSYGLHTIDIRSFNSVDNSSDVLSYEFMSYLPLPGDLNHDGIRSVDDIVLLLGQLQAGGGTKQGDLNADDKVDDIDQQLLQQKLAEAGWQTPDFNNDGMLSLMDLHILGEHLGQLNATLAEGDANGDGIIDQEDVEIFTRILTAGSPGNGVPASGLPTVGLAPMRGEVIPQPATLIFILLGSSFMVHRRHKQTG